MTVWLTLVAVALCAASISFTVTISGMFEPMREWIYKKSRFFGQLITCPWCFGHYVVFIIIGISLIRDVNITIPIFENIILDYLFTSFSVIGLMGLFHKVLLVAFDPVMKIKAQREINKLRDAKFKATEQTNK